jgi:hypothetical protein
MNPQQHPSGDMKPGDFHNMKSPGDFIFAEESPGFQQRQGIQYEISNILRNLHTRADFCPGV